MKGAKVALPKPVLVFLNEGFRFLFLFFFSGTGVPALGNSTPP